MLGESLEGPSGQRCWRGYGRGGRDEVGSARTKGPLAPSCVTRKKSVCVQYGPGSRAMLPCLGKPTVHRAHHCAVSGVRWGSGYTPSNEG